MCRVELTTTDSRTDEQLREDTDYFEKEVSTVDVLGYAFGDASVDQDGTAWICGGSAFNGTQDRAIEKLEENVSMLNEWSPRGYKVHEASVDDFGTESEYEHQVNRRGLIGAKPVQGFVLVEGGVNHFYQHNYTKR